MIYNQRLTTIGDLASALQYLAELKAKNPGMTLLDVGASANPWSGDYITHVVDVENRGVKAQHFIGNISDRKVWDEVLEYVKVHGKFDFLVSTHTLEDISAAALCCNMFSLIAKEGYIAIPSKYAELSKPEGEWLGYIHHRWIYDMEGDKFMGYPKQNFLEYMPYVHDWAGKNPRAGREELQFFWKDDVYLNVVNGDLLGPTQHHVIDYYRALVK